MRGAQEVFTEVGAEHLIGRRVKLIHVLPGRYLGETGQVTDKIGWHAGYRVQVTWDIGYASGEKRIDYFTPELFREFLREV